MRHVWAAFAYTSIIFNRLSSFFLPIFIFSFLITVGQFNYVKTQQFPQWKKMLLLPTSAQNNTRVITQALKEGQYSLANKLASIGSADDKKLGNLPDQIKEEELFWESVIRMQPTASQALSALAILMDSKGELFTAEKLRSQAEWLKPTPR